MTSRERVLKVLNHGVPDRVPTSIAAWPYAPCGRDLVKELDARNGLGFSVEHSADIIEVKLPIPFPSGPVVVRDGITWVTDPIIQTYDELDEFQWPDPDDPAILAPLRDANNMYPEKAIILDIVGPITRLHGMRLMDNIYTDFFECPEKAALSLQIPRTPILSTVFKVHERCIKFSVSALGHFGYNNLT